MATRIAQYRASHVESKAPNFVAALREQLGLELYSWLRTEPVLVIDRIERPVLAQASVMSRPKLIPMIDPGQQAPSTPASALLSPAAAKQPTSFCCPDYLDDMLNRIHRNWDANQSADGLVTMRFAVQRTGEISEIQVARSSGREVLDEASREALDTTRELAPLPGAFPDPTLTVTLDFRYTH